MTIQSLKGLVKKEIEAATEILAKGHNDIQLINHNIGKASAFKQVFDILNQLSAPELEWNVETDKCYSSTPVKLLQYNIQEKSDPDNAFFLYFNTRFQEWFETMEEAKAAAQAHWNELYNQIINL